MKGLVWNWFRHHGSIGEPKNPENSIGIEELKKWLLGHKDFRNIEVIIRSVLIPQLQAMASRKPSHCAHHVAVAEVHQVVKTFLGQSWANEITFDLETYINKAAKPF
jgi:hypothetical protein